MVVAQSTGRGRVVRIVVAVVALLVLVAGAAVVLLRERAEDRFGVVAAAVKESALPAGAVEHPKFARARGRGLDAYGCISASCPFVRRVWFVPVAAGQERQLARSVLTGSGFQVAAEPGGGCGAPEGDGITDLCTLEGTNGQIRLAVTLQTIGQESPPSRGVPADREWRMLQVDAQLR